MIRPNAHGFGLEVVVNGRALPIIEHDGKLYVAAPWDTDFKLRFTTPYGGRYEAVASVDGLDIITGKTASKDAGGYVVTGSAEIPGFRLNNSEVAAFHFGDRADSYAAQLDKPKNIGVLAVVFYSERPYIRTLRSITKGGCMGGGLEGNTRGGGATRGGVGHDMGTEFGQRQEHKVNTTTFQRHSQLATIVIEYASREKLIEAGIIRDTPLGNVNPFPADNEPGCKPPKKWRGK
ncbi:MAG: hypothetical protein IT343_02880 [Candidatus Melainabacteria bacterium]|jgi:hypothetical protein|nr:hypothetical protein [Candidatus Melainabacteria bacterium]